jgi:glycerophosphoryl diester phosphodiesterase
MYAAIRARGMQDQCLVKTGADPRVLSILEEHAADMPFLAIVRNGEELRAVRRRKLRHEGAEVLFDSEESPFASVSFVEREHRAGRLVWVNAIVYHYKAVLAAGHSDDRATAGGDPEGSWGWLADRGYDFIQTDWLLACAQFLESTGRRCSR